MDWRVEIEGEDISQDLRPYLMSISATDKVGLTSDRCSLVLDDTDGQIKLPSAGSKLTVYLENYKVFEGVTERPKSTGSRGGGMKLTVKAKGTDDASKIKQPLTQHKDGGSLEDFLQGLGKTTGVEIVVDKALGGITRNYWGVAGVSLLQAGQQLAKEHSGIFKVRGKKAILKAKGTDDKLPEVVCERGKNLISWSVEPRDLRRVFAGGKARHFDRKTAKVKEVKRPWKQAEIDGGLSSGDERVDNALRAMAADESTAEKSIDAAESRGRREGGTGTVTINLEPAAQAEAPCRLKGLRSGIDGLYRIESRTHKASRGAGATTTLKIKDPQGGAGER